MFINDYNLKIVTTNIIYTSIYINVYLFIIRIIVFLLQYLENSGFHQVKLYIHSSSIIITLLYRLNENIKLIYFINMKKLFLLKCNKLNP